MTLVILYGLSFALGVLVGVACARILIKRGWLKK